MRNAKRFRESKFKGIERFEAVTVDYLLFEYKNKTMKNALLLTINKEPVSTWQGFKELCEAYDLPYHSLKSKPFPRQWREFEVLKLPFRCRGQENE